MAKQRAVFHSRSPDDTARFAVALGALLRPGDTLLLSGDIGAGKSHFARALIQSLLPIPEDVPSPTFTLVQTYLLAESELWHADLYRLSDPDQVVELGLIDAFDSAICLVEWPDRLQELAPDDALTIRLDDPDKSDTRRITLSWSDPRWTALVNEAMA